MIKASTVWRLWTRYSRWEIDFLSISKVILEDLPSARCNKTLWKGTISRKTPNSDINRSQPGKREWVVGVNAPVNEFAELKPTLMLMRQCTVANTRDHSIWYGGYQFLPGTGDETRLGLARPWYSRREREREREKNPPFQSRLANISRAMLASHAKRESQLASVSNTKPSLTLGRKRFKSATRVNLTARSRFSIPALFNPG